MLYCRGQRRSSIGCVWTFTPRPARKHTRITAGASRPRRRGRPRARPAAYDSAAWLHAAGLSSMSPLRRTLPPPAVDLSDVTLCGLQPPLHPPTCSLSALVSPSLSFYAVIMQSRAVLPELRMTTTRQSLVYLTKLMRQTSDGSHSRRDTLFPSSSVYGNEKPT